MRITFSLSDAVARELQRLAERVAEGNASSVAEVAIRRLLSQPASDVARLVARQRLDRKASTRNGWAAAFWRILGDEMAVIDSIENPLTARNYGDYYAVLLLNHPGRYDDENDPFIIQVAPQMWTPENAHKQRRFRFERSRSPVDAAEEIAAWLTGTQPEKSEVERQTSVPQPRAIHFEEYADAVRRADESGTDTEAVRLLRDSTSANSLQQQALRLSHSLQLALKHYHGSFSIDSLVNPEIMRAFNPQVIEVRRKIRDVLDGNPFTSDTDMPMTVTRMKRFADQLEKAALGVPEKIPPVIFPLER